jgi:16S rRNA (guanine966-N2)-methyltransferase
MRTALFAKLASIVRVIAGELRGRRPKAPEGERARPVPDRVREGLLATLRPRIEGAIVLELLAGSGALGIEARARA